MAQVKQPNDEEEEEEYHSQKQWEHVRPEKVAEWILNPKKHTHSFLIVDVRDFDFKQHGLKIKNAVNHPMNSFKANVQKLANTAEMKQPEMLVFHCMFSQFRGPQC